MPELARAYVEAGGLTRQMRAWNEAAGDLFGNWVPITDTKLDTMATTLTTINTSVTSFQTANATNLTTLNTSVNTLLAASAFTSASSSVSTSLAQQAIINCGRFLNLGISITNTGAAALTNFQLLARIHPTAPFSTLADEAGDFTAPPTNSVIKFVSANPMTLIAGANCTMGLDVSCIADIAIWAASTAGTTIQIITNAKGL